MPNYNLFRKDRIFKGHGSLGILTQSHFTSTDFNFKNFDSITTFNHNVEIFGLKLQFKSTLLLPAYTEYLTIMLMKYF